LEDFAANGSPGALSCNTNRYLRDENNKIFQKELKYIIKQQC